MPTWLPWLLIIGTVLVGVMLTWYFFAGGEEEVVAEGADGVDPLSVTAAEHHLRTDDPLATTAEEFRAGSRKSRINALRQSLERSLDSREGIAQGSTKDRMVMPWFMLVGADGSGKKTILANNGLDLPWGPPIEVDSQRKDAGKWWLYEDAVVLEAPAATPGTTVGSSTLAPDQTVADASLGWSTLLHMLRRERPDSPLNGIIVTIACSDLIGARVNADKMEEQADRIRTFLERTRKLLGVRLPLHVLVTKCDTLPGFKSFAEALPESRRQDIFGWSNPNHPEVRFEPTWVDRGFTQLEEQLSNLRDEVLAAPEEVRDSVGVFVFDSEFSDLQEPLKAFVARLMTPGERRPSLFFRGFYFTGDAIDASEARRTRPDAARNDLQQGKGRASRISAEVAGEPHNLVFLKSLFADRIFKEAGLARASAKFRLARDRRVVFAQAAALLITAGGGFGLWTSVNGLRTSGSVYQAGLRADAAMLTRVLSGVAIDLDALRKGDSIGAGSPLERRARDAAVIELADQMRDIPSMRVRSPFLPTSWFSDLPRDIRVSMLVGVQNIVLPVTRQRLMERADRLLGSADAVSRVPDELDPEDPRSITSYLSAVRALSRNIMRYNSIADSTSGSVAELSALLDYLFGERIIADSDMAGPDLERALVHAAGPTIQVSAEMPGSVVRRAVAMVSTVAGTASRQLAPRTSEAAERAIRPEADLEALHGLSALVDLIDAKRGIVATVGDSAILGVKLARAIEDSVAAQLQLAAVRIAPDTLAPDSSARRLRNVVSQLYAFRLMRPIERLRVASEPRPNERLLWDIGSLELALSLQSEFLQAIVATAVAFPGQSPERLRRALEVQLRARAVDVAASAQRFTPLGAIEDPFAEVKLQGANLESAASRIVRVSIMLDSLGAGAEGQKLIAAGARQAEQALGIAQNTFERNRYLAPVGPSIVAWQGVLPFKFVALGTSDSLTFGTTLLRHETEIRTLAHDLVPSLRYLRLDAVADSVRFNGLLETWEEILTAVLRYERGDLTSTMGMLHRFLVGELSVSDLETCRNMAMQNTDVGPSTDVFVVRRRQFRAALASRCMPNGSSAAVAEYQRLRLYFQTRLSGRYPFADTLSAAPVDAVASDVRDFVRQYNAFSTFGEVALRSDPRLTQTGRAALGFLEQFAPARDFLAAFGEQDAPREMPEYSLLVASGASRDSLMLAQLTLRVGSREHFVDVAPVPVHWRAPDAMTVVLTPFDTSKVRVLASAGGTWAALRLAQRPGTMSVKVFHPDTKLRLPVPVFPISAPEILILRGR